jgi:hypothetical protein
METADQMKERIKFLRQSFHGRSKAHVDDLTSELTKRGCKILYSDKHPHAGGSDSCAVFFEDPDRIKVEAVAP